MLSVQATMYYMGSTIQHTSNDQTNPLAAATNDMVMRPFAKLVIAVYDLWKSFEFHTTVETTRTLSYSCVNISVVNMYYTS